ncbi:MAG: isoleucine--tRNA ligase, partial [Planctomycetes bacterium]|nr:isoleucine--tRNA ligase [Planctomycetota bacterium]
MFGAVSTNPDFPTLERDVLRFWKESGAFRKLVAKNARGKAWSFFDGPITANNPMGVHHAWGRTYKDVFQRYHAMLGHRQRYQNGFDCQGLWVEVEVEKDLGLDSKRDIAAYGLDKFSVKCRERVEKYSAIQTEQSIRLGQWMDWANSYFTMSDTNIEHIWRFLKVCRERGWLYKGHRSMPWCVRCGTSLSQHELIDSYREMTHQTVTVRARIVGRPNESFLVWTTTPWTLAANVALALHPDLTYAKVKQGDEIFYLSKGTLARLTGKHEVVGEVKGADLLGLEFETFFPSFDAQKGVKHQTIPWAAVSDAEGTGVVHIAPGCGAEDFELSKTNDLAVLVPIDDDGNYVAGYGAFSGQNIAKLTHAITEDLKSRGVLYRTEQYTHRYPCCWRCKHELVFKVVDEWFIACNDIRPKMIEAARTVRWMPDYMGKRMEDWLVNMGDWCISRKRFWGLPLPFYFCECGGEFFASSKADLMTHAVPGTESPRELHRPWIDEVKVRCPKCGKPVSRVLEVGDCWLDAGIIPFSTLRYREDDAYWREWFPAEFVCEMREQIRLWFYAQLFMSVTLEGRAPYRAVLSYEKLQDEKGKDMHKSAGNAIWLDDATEKMGADVMRWLYAGQNVQSNMRFGYNVGRDVKTKMMTFWNVASFFATYANEDKPDCGCTLPAKETLGRFDRWILARLHQLVGRCRDSYENYDVAAVTREVERFWDDLSNWYVRRNRRRFWKSTSDEDKQAAYRTLYEVLSSTIRVIAPVLPFTAEHLYQLLVKPVDAKAPESVHHCAFPEVDANWLDERLLADMDVVLRVVRLGRAAREQKDLKVRQPLARTMIKVETAEERAAVESFRLEILDELNVKAAEFEQNARYFTDIKIKPNLKTLGPKHGKLLKEIYAALEFVNPFAFVEKLRKGETVELLVESGAKIPLTSADVIIEETPRAHLACATEGSTVVGLDVVLTPELMEEGWIRDLVRYVQEMRKTAGYQVADRIQIRYQALGPMRSALAKHKDYV